MDNDTKLWRLYYRYEILDLAYDFSQQQEIESLYENLTETYEARAGMNNTVRAIIKALELKSIRPLSNIAAF
ncbi:hypothetical protein [uncultured Thiodictyon sp.]|uniref:hypothetical protein n=1 Tax=uncultured Thiodictyon sp. TaxID=1846217 RepID=UPI0025FC89B6|nr:hypothetical protein [uncultured Thiodictyon sp.]